MKNNLLTIVLFALICHGLQGQSNSPQVVANAGTHSTTANAQVSWTVGEVLTSTLSAGSNTATQGFHQTLLTVVALDKPIADFQIEVFPNPASTQLNVRFGAPTSAALQIVDMHGRIVIDAKADDTQFRTLDLNGLAQGAYVLRILGDQPSKIQKFKIQVIPTL